jgi:hypothetical protein
MIAKGFEYVMILDVPRTLDGKASDRHHGDCIQIVFTDSTPPIKEGI